MGSDTTKKGFTFVCESLLLLLCLFVCMSVCVCVCVLTPGCVNIQYADMLSLTEEPSGSRMRQDFLLTA